MKTIIFWILLCGGVGSALGAKDAEINRIEVAAFGCGGAAIGMVIGLIFQKRNKPESSNK